MSALPVGCPAIPPEASVDDLIAIVTVHDPEAVKANRNTRYHKTQVLSQRPGRITRGSLEGCNVFLHKIDGQACYSMGRADSTEGDSESRKRDVYLTDKQAGIRHLCLVPIAASNAWRVQSSCTVEAIVNGVPIQCSSALRREDPERLPCAVYLRQDAVNRITIRGLRVDVWLLKTVQEAYPTVMAPVMPIVNDFVHRSEPWAQRDQFLLREQVSTRSHRILHRITGEIFTAKVFRDAPNPWKSRTDEFEKFFKDKVDASLVRYRAKLSIDNLPAVITDTHYGLVSYAAMQPEIRKMHPGNRFLLAAKLQRRLFSALDFLHFHGIIHGSVTLESVLIRLVDRKVPTVLLVDYFAATSVPFGTKMSRPSMLEDGRAAMDIVEDCCNIWHLRNKLTEEAESDVMLVKQICTAQEELSLMKRVANDYLAKGGDRYSDKNRKLLLLVGQKLYDLETVQNRRDDNAKRLAIANCRQSDIDDMAQDWSRTQRPFKIGEMAWMHLSLGHPYFDNLTNELRYNRWESTPWEVCAQFKTLAGAIEEPWQSLIVSKPLSFERRRDQFVDDRIIMWLASCCEIFPEWSEALKTEYSRCVHPHGGLIQTHDLLKLREALSNHGNLPPSIIGTFEALLASKVEDVLTVHCTALHNVTLHVPSRMFNLTQLQRLASPERFAACVRHPNTRCDTFVEVRGEPSLQGCYAPLALLSEFVQQLGLRPLEPPEVSTCTPVHDPADFSQVSAGRIVLVRTGLIAFASMTRDGNQCVFYAPRIPSTANVLSEGTFLATYFGNMKIFPSLAQGNSRYSRPGHWSGFKTAEEQERAADLSQRKIATPNPLVNRCIHPLSRHGPEYQDRGIAPRQSFSTEPDQSRLAEMLRDREHRRTQARPRTKRNTDVQDEELDSPSAKRTRTLDDPSTVAPTDEKPEQSAADVEMMGQGVVDTGENSGTDACDSAEVQDDDADQTLPSDILFDLPYSVQEGEFDMDAEWAKAEEWVAELTAREAQDSPPIEGRMSIFRISAPSVADTDATVADSLNEAVLIRHRAAMLRESTSNTPLRKSMAKAKAKAMINAETTPTAYPAVQSRLHTLAQPRPSTTPSRAPAHRPADSTDASTLDTPSPPFDLPSGGQSEDPSTQDMASIPQTPAFSSPTPTVSNWLSGIGGNEMPDPNEVSMSRDETAANAVMDGDDDGDGPSVQ